MSEQNPWTSAETYTWEQDMRRGEWPTKRTPRMPDTPWPSPDNPMLSALLHDARKNSAGGMTTDIAMLQLATHCCFEGGIEGYDRGQLDARCDGSS
jgi:hypothetical protein